jgi:6-hydroxytryprostatin B O-methyltransferase
MGNSSQDGLRGLIVGSSPLELLVLDLNEQTRVLSNYLRTNGLPEPSFKRDGPIAALPPQAPEEMRIAREKLLDDALQIFQLVSGPGEYLPNVIASVGSLVKS